MQRFTRNQAVIVSTNGITVEGTIADGKLSPFYPDSTVTKYGNGSSGRTAWGYQVRSPIVREDGTLYTDRNGRPLMGLGYVEVANLAAK